MVFYSSDASSLTLSFFFFFFLSFLGFSEESGKLRDPSKSAVGSSLASFLTFLAGVTCSSSLISFFLLIVWSFPES